MKALAKTFEDLPWIILLILVIFFDGLVGGVIRLANGKKVTTKIAGVVLFVSFILSVLSFLGILVSVPALIWNIARIIYVICWICDVVTVAFYKKITVLAE